MTIETTSVERRKRLSAEDFYGEFVDKKPLVIEGIVDGWRAFDLWKPDYFEEIAGDVRVKVKRGDLTRGLVDFLPLAEYLRRVEAYEERRRRGEAGPEDRPAYLHDVPMLAMADQLVQDVEPFPVEYLPRWYRERWWLFSQFFYGPTHSLTPLHFDTLETHNIFFQVTGRKRFLMVPPSDRDKCYIFKWRWSEVDAEQPDLDRHPRFRDAQVIEAVVGPGEILYMPPGTLHHVRSLDPAISFNIDWQTPRSALRGVAALTRGMPLKNVYYNSVAALGLWTRLPSKVLFPLYKSYLDYVS
ncbi:MAG: cupin-like domain-containing protein [bacterium]